MVGCDGVVVVTPTVLNLAVISVFEGEASLDNMDKELKEWGLENWYWQLDQLCENEFGMVIPSRESLSMVSKGASFTLPLH